jgi:hypothetical protein
MSMTDKEYWMGEARKFESWFYRANYLRTQQEADNVELRKLVRDMWDFFCVVPNEPHTSKEEIDFSVEVWRRMRELGVDE